MAAAETLAISRGIDDRVKDVDGGVKDVDHKVGLIIHGELNSISPAPNRSSTLPDRCKRNRSSGSRSAQSIQRPKEFVIV